MHSERFYIDKCLHQIEEKYQLGNEGAKWRQRDMEYLVELINQQSGILISLSTIKRLCKNDSQLPQPSTLDALVSTLGYGNWQEYKISNHQSNTKKAPIALILSLSIITVLVGWFMISGFGTTPKLSKVEVTGNVSFTADKTITNGVPNTVIFKYDLSNVVADSFFIQQSWNELERMPIDQQGEYHTSIYYYPGFHRAKLIANDSIIVRKFIHITTDGWFPIVRQDYQDRIPGYINRKFTDNQPLNLSETDLRLAGLDPGQNFITTYFNVKDFEGVHSDNFQFNSRLKVDSIKNLTCPFLQINIMTEQHIFSLPLVAKGCESTINLKLGEVYQSGRNNDLSAFGCNVYQWQDLKLKVINKLATVYLNDSPIREVKFKEDFGKVVGLSISFSGIGSVEFADIEHLDIL